MTRGQLPKTLAAMLAKAYRNVGEVQRTELRRGLVVELYVDSSRQLHLLLWRPDVYPSELEWKTILLSLPGELYLARPEPEYRRSRRCLGLTGVLPAARPNPFGTPESSNQTKETNP